MICDGCYYRIHDNTRNRTMVRIAHRVLVRMRGTRNVLIRIMAHGVVAGENTLPMAQYAPGCVPPSPWCRVDGTAGGGDERGPMVLP